MAGCSSRQSRALGRLAWCLELPRRVGAVAAAGLVVDRPAERLGQEASQPPVDLGGRDERLGRLREKLPPDPDRALVEVRAVDD